MILVTSAPNDKALTQRLKGVSQVAPIPYGDVCWFGVWIGGQVISVCGDRKRMNDFLNCVENGHHVQQIQDARAGGMDCIFVIWEHDQPMRGDPMTGMVQLYRKGKGWWTRTPMLHINRVYAYINELEWYQGIHVIETRSLKETAERIKSLYLMFQEPPEKHHAVDLFYSPPPPKEGLLTRRPSLVRRVAKELSGVGWERSKAVESRFKTVRELVNATEKEWLEVPGIGKKTASSVQEELG